MYIMGCLVIAAVRWFHMCRPYDRNPLYYYPGRKATTLAYLMSLTLIPSLIIFLVFQKQVYAGLASGSVKG